MIDLCFHNEPEVALKVKDLYTKPPEPAGSDDEEEFDAETMELVTELMLQDEANGQDLKNFKDDIDRKTARRLVQKKKQYQREEAATRAQKLKRKQALNNTKKKVRPQLKKSLARKRKRASADSAPPAPDGPSPGPAPAAPAAPVDPADPSPMPPLPASHRHPEGWLPPVNKGGEWEAPIPVKGGFINWSAQAPKGHCDGHCRLHSGPAGRECKMDRLLSLGSTALIAEWLAIGEGLDYDLHQIMKETLCSSDSMVTRRDRRAQLVASRNPEIQRLLAAEKELRGGEDCEPASFRCVSAFSVGKRIAASRAK